MTISLATETSKTMRSVFALSIVFSVVFVATGSILLLKKEESARLEATKFISGLRFSLSDDQMEKVAKDLFAMRALVTVSQAHGELKGEDGLWTLDPSVSAASTTIRRQDGQAAQDLFVKIQWQTPFAMTGDAVAWMIILGLPLVLFLLTIIMAWIIQNRLVTPTLIRLQELTDKAAEARNMQMFAHDIRKPFSALKAMINLLQHQKNSDGILPISKKLLPELDSMILHVDGMIEDVMKKQIYSPEAVSVDRLLVSSIREAARRHPNASHRLTWALRHSLKPAAFEKPMVRSLANIFCNAIEATSSDDSIWVATNDCDLNGSTAVEITIGNSGSVIPDDTLAKLFDSYFTSGKKDGTGLGLAYVKKAIDGMGGQITVRSSADRGTEFTLMLPSVPILDKQTSPLPKMFNEDETQSFDNRRQNEVVAIIRETLTRKGRGPIRILVVEDDGVYFDAVVMALPQNEDDGAYCVFDQAKTYDQAVTMIGEHTFDIVICDVDLGLQSVSGLEVVHHIVRQEVEVSIYMHTNKKLTMEDSRFVETHTRGFLAKPVAAGALLKIAHDQAVNTPSRNQVEDTRPTVAIIDDDCFVRELWSLQTHDIDPYLFDSPASFLTAVKKDSGLLSLFDAIIIDYYFDNDSGTTGDLLALEIKELVQVPIIMSSDVTHLPNEATDPFDARIEKSCFSWDEVSKRLAQ